MSPRYNRTNKRYKVKIPKEKMSFPKKVFIQSVLSLSVFCVLLIYSFFSAGKMVTSYLDTSYGLNDWKSFFVSAGEGIKEKTSLVAETYLSFVEKADKKVGIKEPKGETALAHKEDEIKPDTVPEGLDEEEPRRWYAPVEGSITSHFGDREHPVNSESSLHTGIDIGADMGTTVVAAAKGVVSKVGQDSANGNFVFVEHAGGITTAYAHLETIAVTEGEYVSEIIKIGTVGSTGISTGPHLHFEIKVDGKSVDPESYILFNEG